MPARLQCAKPRADNHGVWSVRWWGLLGLTTLLIVVDVAGASQAGAYLVPASTPATFAHSEPVTRPTPRLSVHPPRRPQPKPRVPAPSHTVRPRVVVSTTPPHVQAQVQRVTKPSPAPPTGCAAVVASVVWPATWHPSCAGPRTGILGLTSPDGTTTLYVRSDETDAYLRIVALHEAGHAWDFARLNSTKIAQWCAARGCDAARFFSGGASGAGWHEPGGAEDWAAAWDACHGGEYHRAYLGLSPPTNALCQLQNALVGYSN